MILKPPALSPEKIANDRKSVLFKTIYTWLYDGLLNVPKDTLRYVKKSKQRNDGVSTTEMAYLGNFLKRNGFFKST